MMRREEEGKRETQRRERVKGRRNEMRRGRKERVSGGRK